jgi:predicted HicB family RNase H-like nuclease
MTSAKLLREVLSDSIRVVLTPHDKQALKAKAKQQRLSVSHLIREALYHQGLLDP